MNDNGCAARRGYTESTKQPKTSNQQYIQKNIDRGLSTFLVSSKIYILIFWGIYQGNIDLFWGLSKILEIFLHQKYKLASKYQFKAARKSPALQFVKAALFIWKLQ